LQCNHSMVRVAQNPKPYFTVSSDTPLTIRGRFPYLYLPGTGWPSYTPEHWVPFTSSLTTCLLRLARIRWRYSNPPPTWRDRSLYIQSLGIGWSSPKSSQCQSQKLKSRYERRPVNQYVLVPSPLGIKGVPPEKFQFDIRRFTIRRNFITPQHGQHRRKILHCYIT
jgi:hypothetical protein